MEGIRKQMKSSAQKLSLGLLWKELQVFSKLLFRGRNQHRRDKSYQRLLRISKDLKRYQVEAMANHVKKLFKAIQTSTNMSPHIDSQATVVATKLIECGVFTSQLLQFIEVTFIEVHQRLTMSLFIPFNLLMVSSLSRMWYCLHYHLSSLCEVYLAIISELVTNASHKFKPSLWDYLDRKHCFKRKVKPPKFDTSSLGTVIPRSTFSVPDATTKDDVSFPASPPALSCVTNTNTSSQDSVQHDIIIPTIAKKDHDSDTMSPKVNSDINHIFDIGSISGVTGTSLCPNIQRKLPKRRSVNTCIIVVKCGRRLVQLNIRSKKLLLRLHQGYKDKPSLRVKHLRLGVLRTVPVGVPRYRASRFRLKLLAVDWKENRNKLSKTKLKRGNESKTLSAVKKLQHRFTEELEMASAAPGEKRSNHIKLIHQLKTNNDTCNEIDDIFSILDE